jgi:AraC-like DNA-binding protein
MNTLAHLRIETMNLLPGQEWTDGGSTWRFVRVSKGSAYWLDSARPRALAEGELVVIAPRHQAIVRASQIGEVVLHRFCFAPDLLCGFFSVAERGFLDGGAGFDGPVWFLPSTHGLGQRFAALANHTDPWSDTERRAAVLGLVAAFVSEAMSQGHRSARGTAQERFDQLISEMPDLELISYTAAQMARLCGCSPRQFNRLFRQRFGEAPRARQTELRLLRASHVLAHTDGTIAQASFESGFRSLSLFNALFKRRFGASPSEWRRRAKADITALSDERPDACEPA